MTSPEPDITVTLTAREARVLSHAADFSESCWSQVRTSPEISALIGDGVPPLQSAAMKLEMALVQAQVAP